MNNWEIVNRKLVAKTISELNFEEVFIPESTGENKFKLLLKKDIEYKFEARLSAWGHLWVNWKTINRGDSPNISASQFFIDSQLETKMDDVTLSHFLNELNNTLYADLKIIESQPISSDDLAALDGNRVQFHLDGHPKLLLNKGRIGWNINDLRKYSPENQSQFQLRWILIKKEYLKGKLIPISETIIQSFNLEEAEVMRKRVSNFEHDYDLIPVHPWQWDNVICQQYQSEIQNKNIIDFGIAGDLYSPQVSLRTLSNVSRPKMNDIKLPLSILNTSCYRGIPHKYLSVTPQVSIDLADICLTDEILRNFRVEVLIETKTAGYLHPHYQQLDQAPYRYYEQLGAIYRESAQSKIGKDEKAIIVASLLYQDKSGKTLLQSYAELAGIKIEEWIKLYAQFVIIPLYHLQISYGIGLVAHGQNIMIRLNKYRPCGIFIKDFQGDLRLSTEHKTIHKKHFKSNLECITHLIPQHLIHDLVTGHLITVLRFLAGALDESSVIKEEIFYKIIAAEVEKYQRDHLQILTDETDILSPRFHRILINSVRFKITHGDMVERPLPVLGNRLKNPLHVGALQ